MASPSYWRGLRPQQRFHSRRRRTIRFTPPRELVLVNVTVRDRNGNPVRDLKREDFTVLEDNKPQQVISFDLENTDAVLSTAATEAPLLGKTSPSNPCRSARHAGDASVERPPAHHFVFRSQLHAAGRSRPGDHGSAELRGQADGCGRSGLRCLAGRHAVGESGFHLGPGAAEDSAAGLQSRRGRRI